MKGKLPNSGIGFELAFRVNLILIICSIRDLAYNIRFGIEAEVGGESK